jgi:nucleotidyltransferase substrate binding protein (TIGR01987 family)
MKDFLEYQGFTGITGPRDATREAFKRSLVINGQVWMEMIISRNQTSHTYNEVTAHTITSKVKSQK